ncbi:hypothetical protein BDY21DRAFT_113602 [Lineolata rhizophorae]|uniref:RRM domain-containing protein n=1 Tax=Lineolata rhizophorae TaxID=578093 RepID=A0A6A6NR11_9PEZI|nr:hypothetical protein BDY21DRAFT_113602 [Lineolata rhizophorae]
MNNVRAIQELNKRELTAGISTSASWHNDYRDTAFVFIGGLPFDLSEGDVITIFSQFGEPVWLKLARDKETGKSRGFGWLKYEDQRSTDLAVDNLGGTKVLGRTLRVDHARYKPRENEDMEENALKLVDGGMAGQRNGRGGLDIGGDESDDDERRRRKRHERRKCERRDRDDGTERDGEEEGRRRRRREHHNRDSDYDEQRDGRAQDRERERRHRRHHRRSRSRSPASRDPNGFEDDRRRRSRNAH